MTYGKKWHDCPCGESIAVSESDWGKLMLTEWRKAHAACQPAEPHTHEWREIAITGGSRWACICGADKPEPGDPS